MDDMVIYGDSLEEMNEFPGGQFDAVITDPPFGLGKDYNGTKEEASDPDEYWKWFEPFVNEMKRMVKPGGFFAIWQSQKNFKKFWDWYGEDIHIYIGAKNFVQIRPGPIQYGYDPIVMFYQPGEKPLKPKIQKRSVDYFVADTASVVLHPENIEKQHPYPRPLDQAIEIVSNFVIENGIVLDPFAGSGTVHLACKRTGRKCVSIEHEHRFYELIHKRLGSYRTLFEWDAFDEFEKRIYGKEMPPNIIKEVK